jgi:hypothetical protein
MNWTQDIYCLVTDFGEMDDYSSDSIMKIIY